MAKKAVEKTARQALLEKAEALKKQIRETEGFDTDLNLMYAHREAGNLITWLSR